MPWLLPILQFLKEVGAPACIVSGIIIFCSGIYVYERAYAEDKYFSVEDGQQAIENSQANHALLVTIREDQLAQKITSTHREWCIADRIGDASSKSFSWRLLQEKQKKYKELTKNGPYDHGDCPT